jgi:hypothetical protein
MELGDGDFGASKFDELKKYLQTLPRVDHHDGILIQEEDAVSLRVVGVVVVGYAVMLLERSVVFEVRDFAGLRQVMEEQLHD